MTSRRRTLTLGLGLAVLVPLVVPATGGATPADNPPVRRAVAYLRSQQQADGGFEVAQFAGYETSDAILALASAGQVGSGWSTAEARADIVATKKGAKNPLDAIDDLVDGETDATSIAAGARSAKVVALVANPLGISATDFDPSDDSAGPVDLVARMNSHAKPDGSYDFGAQFNGALYAAIALDGLGRPVPAGLVAQIKAAQNTDGSWDYTGIKKATSDDVDTTSLALLALHAAGLTTADASVKAAAGFLAGRQQPSGAWLSFGSPDANSTSVAAIALSALHVDVTVRTWGMAFGVAVASGTPYASPYAWLLSQQEGASGRFRSPNDGSGINTFATSQAVQALATQWYLDPERRAFVDSVSQKLGSPDAAPSRAAAGTASDVLGGNVAIGSARTASAAWVLASSYGREAAAADLFQQAFGRSIDAGGEAYWSNQLIKISRPEMLSRLTGSQEFYRAAGGTTPTFVTAVYRSVLGRDPEPGGQAYWTAKLTKGTPVESVARSLVASTEYRRNQVDASYQELLGRPADAAGRAYWTKKLATTRIENLLAGVAGSREFFERG